MRVSRATLPTILLASVAGALLAACQLEITYQGRYSCSEPPHGCPTGLVCEDGLCIDPFAPPPGPPVDQPDAALPGQPDATPVPSPPDAGVPVGGAPDAETPPPVTFLVTFGERPGAMVQGVTHDAYLEEAFPDNNHGFDDVVAFDSAPQRHGLLEFDLDSLPTTLSCFSAELLISVNDPIETGEMRIFSLLESWVPGNVTWNHRDTGLPWSTPGAGTNSHAPGTMAVSAPRTVGEFIVPLDCAVITGWIQNPASNHGMVVIAVSPDGRGGEFRSSNNTNGSQRPLLRLVVGQ